MCSYGRPITARPRQGNLCAYVQRGSAHVRPTAAVYRRPIDGDGPFERSHDGLPDWFGFNIDTFQLAAHDHVAAVGTKDGEVYVSSDEGATWTLAAKDLPPVRCVALV